MPDESVPHIRETNVLLKNLTQINSRIDEKLAGQAREIASGFKLVHDNITAQTETLSGLEIIARIAEMEGVQNLIAEEERILVEELERDSSAIDQLEQSFHQSREEIASARNQRVRRLLEPIYGLMDRDLEQHLEARMEVLGDLFNDFLEVTREAIGERESALRTTIEQAQKQIEEFIGQRRQVREAVQQVQHDPEHFDAEETGTAYAVPFYLVEIENDDGTTGSQVLAPFIASANSDQPSGFERRELRGFSRICENLHRQTGELWRLFGSPQQGCELSLAEVVPPPPDAVPLLQRWALRSRFRRLAQRSVRLIEARPGVPGLAAVFQAQVGSRAAAAERQGVENKEDDDERIG